MSRSVSRRQTLHSTLAALATTPLVALGRPALAQDAESTEEGSMFSPKFVQQYADFQEAPQGYSYRDVSEGKGSLTASQGDRVAFEFSGYTIGYFGRPFEAKGGPQGGAFDKDLDY